MCLVCLLYVGCVLVLAHTFDPFKKGPIREVNLDGWEQLEQGMSKAAVARLLGAPGNKFRQGLNLGGTADSLMETWEYNWSAGITLFGIGNPKAYIVVFSPDATLFTWRAPMELKPPTPRMDPTVPDAAPITSDSNREPIQTPVEPDSKQGTAADHNVR